MNSINGNSNSIEFRRHVSYPGLANGAANGSSPNQQRVTPIQQDDTLAQERFKLSEVKRLEKKIESLQQRLAEKDSELEALNQELATAIELQNTFLGMAAHDLRGTLSSVRVAALVLLDVGSALSQAESRSFLKDIAKQINYVWEMMGVLLDVTQFELGKLHIAKKTVDIPSFLQRVVNRQRQVATAKNITINLALTDAGTIRADPIRLQQVIDNLISNAIKYSPRNSTVSVQITQLPSVLRVAVQDEGPGIEEEKQKCIFHKFVRLEDRPTSGEPGVGLGLAISRHVVEAHGGQIGVKSTPGQGATFWFTLPT